MRERYSFYKVGMFFCFLSSALNSRLRFLSFLRKRGSGDFPHHWSIGPSSSRLLLLNFVAYIPSSCWENADAMCLLSWVNLFQRAV